MLRGLRKASGNLIGKTIMALVVGFLVVSFGIWGIADMFRGYGLSSVATIGRTDISADQFRQTFNDRLQQLGRQVGRPLTAQQARAFGLERQVLSQLMADGAIDQEARSLRLGIADAEIARRITDDPTFHGINGQFDQSRFATLIRQAGFNEPRFVAEQRRQALRKQLLDTVNGALSVPRSEADAINRYQGEERTIDYIVLGRAQAGDVAAPDDAALRKYFDDHKPTFRAPEFRKLIVLSLTPDEIGRTITIADDDARRAYETRKQTYTTPERRQVSQIVFSNQDDAQKAAERIRGGLSFEDLVKERGLKPSDIDLGLVAKSAIVDPAVAQAAFSLAPDGVSDPVKGRFGVALVHVTKIEPAAQRDYAQVEAELKSDLATERARAEVTQGRDKIEDELAAGSRLDEIAQKLKLPVRVIDAVDRSGRGADGQPVKDLPQGVDVLSGAFGSQVGVENDPLQVKGGGFVWYEVAGISPSRERTFDEVKDEVTTRWRDDETAKRLADKAGAAIDKLKGGASLLEIAAANGVSVQTAKNVKRQAPSALPTAVVTDAFKLAKDAVGTGEGSSPAERIIFRVSDISTPTFDKSAAQAKQIDDILRRAISDELYAGYVTTLQEKLGSSVNQAALNQALGSGGGSSDGN